MCIGGATCLLVCDHCEIASRWSVWWHVSVGAMQKIPLDFWGVEQTRERSRELAVGKRRRTNNVDRIVPDISLLINFMSNSLSPNSRVNIMYNSNTKHVDVPFLPGGKRIQSSLTH